MTHSQCVQQVSVMDWNAPHPTPEQWCVCTQCVIMNNYYPKWKDLTIQKQHHNMLHFRITSPATCACRLFQLHVHVISQYKWCPMSPTLSCDHQTVNTVHCPEWRVYIGELNVLTGKALYTRSRCTAILIIMCDINILTTTTNSLYLVSCQYTNWSTTANIIHSELEISKIQHDGILIHT